MSPCLLPLFLAFFSIVSEGALPNPVAALPFSIIRFPAQLLCQAEIAVELFEIHFSLNRLSELRLF
jgi:hypothetical protein